MSSPPEPVTQEAICCRLNFSQARGALEGDHHLAIGTMVPAGCGVEGIPAWLTSIYL